MSAANLPSGSALVHRPDPQQRCGEPRERNKSLLVQLVIYPADDVDRKYLGRAPEPSVNEWRGMPPAKERKAEWAGAS